MGAGVGLADPCPAEDPGGQHNTKSRTEKETPPKRKGKPKAPGTVKGVQTSMYMNRVHARLGLVVQRPLCRKEYSGPSLQEQHATIMGVDGTMNQEDAGTAQETLACNRLI